MYTTYQNMLTKDILASMFNEAKSTSKYPPYNIIRKSDMQTVLEFALAGYSISDIEITVEKRVLIISGNREKPNHDYQYQGISNRSFVIKFNLSDNVEVQKAEMNNGMLSILVEKIVKEEDKPRKIEIGYAE